MDVKKVVIQCPIHKRDLIVPSMDMGHKQKMNWCPECEQYIPINLSYNELLVEYIKKKSGMDAIGEHCQSLEGYLDVVNTKLSSKFTNASEKLQHLLEQAKDTHLYWGGHGSPEGSPNVLDLIYYKCQIEVIEELQGALKSYDAGDDPYYGNEH